MLPCVFYKYFHNDIFTFLCDCFHASFQAIYLIALGIASIYCLLARLLPGDSSSVFLGIDPKAWHYFLSILMGVGNGTLLVTVLSLISDMIGPRTVRSGSNLKISSLLCTKEWIFLTHLSKTWSVSCQNGPNRTKRHVFWKTFFQTKSPKCTLKFMKTKKFEFPVFLKLVCRATLSAFWKLVRHCAAVITS